jgi:hypothetical protein
MFEENPYWPTLAGRLSLKAGVLLYRAGTSEIVKFIFKKNKAAEAYSHI